MKPALLSLFICFSYLAQSQQNSLEIRWATVKQEKDEARKFELLKGLAPLLLAEDLEKADEASLTILNLATRSKRKEKIWWGKAIRANYLLLNGDLAKAVQELEPLLVLAQKNSDESLTSYILLQLANLYRYKATYDTSILYYSKAEEIVSQNLATNEYIDVKIGLSEYYLVQDTPDLALLEANQAVKSSQMLKDETRLATSLLQVAKCYFYLENFADSRKSLEDALRYINELQYLKAEYQLILGNIFFREGKFTEALGNWTKVLGIYRKSSNRYTLAEHMIQMSNGFQEQGYYELAQEYLSNALSTSERSNYKGLKAEIYHQQSWVYFRTGNNDLSIEAGKKAEQLFKEMKSEKDLARSWDVQALAYRNSKNFEQAKILHQQSLAIREKADSKIELSAGVYNLGEFHLYINEYTIALPYYYRSLALDKTIGDRYGLALNYNRIGRIFTHFKKFDSAYYYLNKSFEFAIPSSSNEVYRDNFLDMAYLFEAQEMPSKAIPFYKKFNILRDSISSQQTAQTLSSYRILYDVERAEQQVSFLEKDKEISKAKIQRQRILVYGLIFILILILLIAVTYFRFSNKLKRLNSSLAEKNEEVQTQSEELIESNQRLASLLREIAEQKEEIQAQAEELTESNFAITEANTQLEEKVEQRTAELKQAFKELDTFFYRSSHDFRRPLTTFMGLAEVAKVLVKEPLALELFERVNENAQNLDKMLRKFQSISDVGTHENIYKETYVHDIVSVEVEKVKDELLRKNIRINIHSLHERSIHSYPSLLSIVIHNLLENAISFSKASEGQIVIRMYELSKEFVLEIYDNGLGIEQEYKDRIFDMYFRANENSKGNGLGLYIVKKTMEKLKGRIIVESTAGVETRIQLIFPFQLI